MIPTGGGRALSTAVLLPIRQGDDWRVKIAWPHAIPRYFGKFNSQAEAEKWIEDHRWLTTQRQKSDVAPPDVE
jgi:hypothetical protein